jgi:hypoxanthine phosphoribosyltransferase
LPRATFSNVSVRSAADIRRDHPDGVHLVCVLKGAFMFLADLTRRSTETRRSISSPCSSYGVSTKSSGQVQLLKDLGESIEGPRRRHRRRHRRYGPDIELPAGHSARARTTLGKNGLSSEQAVAAKIDVKVEYIGFEIPDKFVVGYGLDYGEKYRNLPYIAVLD